MSMNIFRLCGDMSHVFSIIVLLLRLRVAKNAAGERMDVSLVNSFRFDSVYMANFFTIDYIANLIYAGLT